MLHVQHTTLAKSSMITPVLLLLHSWNQILLFQCTYNKHMLLFPLWLFEDSKSFVLKVGITFVFWMGERLGEGRREEKRSAASLSKLPRLPRIWVYILVSHMGGRGPSTCAILHCFPRCMNREMDEKWGSEGLTQHSNTRHPQGNHQPSL